jgi:protein-L-isoaspartate(D-aspartate) O-methyltransferase
MVRDAVVAGGVKTPRIVEAMRQVPRHEFIPSEGRRQAYYDMALPIGHGQTISPPFVVAFMTEQLDPQPSDKVLEIGTGSGYQAAILSELVDRVYSIEIVEPLGKRAKQVLDRLQYDNIHTRIGDGYQGWPEEAPFDKIIVTCSPQNIPTALVDQLREGGRLVVPLGERFTQTLYLFRKTDGEMIAEALEPTMFVPMTGTAEQLRQRLGDRSSRLVNGDFEQSSEEGNWPVGWYYIRQATVKDSETGPGKAVTFTNREPGRPSQLLQAFAVDGGSVKSLDVSMSVSADLIVRGIELDQQAGLLITFFNRKREFIGQNGIGPLNGSFDWTQRSSRIEVPAEAATAVLAVGLLGASGHLTVDDVQVVPR